MTKNRIIPSGRERRFGENEIIVSKTNLKGHITYANRLFMKMSGYSEAELIGKPHNIIRHPDMPRSIFKLLWDRIQGGEEIFAYVLNMARNGDHYWVFAHVTPSRDLNDNINGYHSNRRCPRESVLREIRALYAVLLREEQRHEKRKVGMVHGIQLVNKIMQEKGMSYDEFMFAY